MADYNNLIKSGSLCTARRWKQQLTTMKNMFFSLACMLIGSFALANNNEIKPTNNSGISKELVWIKKFKNDTDKKNSCTVTVKTGTRDVTITVTCECTTSSACNQAYAIATIGLN